MDQVLKLMENKPADNTFCSYPSPAEKRNGYLPCEYDLDGKRIYPATEYNNYFQASDADYVTIEQLFQEHFADIPDVVTRARESFLHKNPVLRHLSDLKICTVQMIPGKHLLVDKTTQRKLKREWVFAILADFNANAVSPIHVAVAQDRPGYYKVWDSQHTLVLLYKMVIVALGGDPDDYHFPCVLSPASSRPELREILMGHNGGAYKNVMDAVELHRQEVHSVRSDGSRDPKKRDSEHRQTLLEKHNVFLALPKSPESKLAGACGNVTEVLNKSYKMPMLEQFLRFFQLACDSQRAMDAKEPWMLMNYFRLCHENGVDFTVPGYVEEMVWVLSDNKDRIWNPDKFYTHAQNAYKKNWKIQNPDANSKEDFKQSLGKTSDGRKFVTQAMLVSQLANYMDKKFAVPAYRFDNWKIQPAELYPRRS